MRANIKWKQGEGELATIPLGTKFEAENLVFFKPGRTLDEAIEEADILVTGPHAGAAVPEEILSHVVPEFTRRLQFDFSDFTTTPIARRWAEIDPKVIYIENPHPRLVRDPNREKPVDLTASLREAFERVRKAGKYEPVNLVGIDAIRPVTFGFIPVLKEPKSDAELAQLVSDFETAANLGVDVYEKTRDALQHRMIDRAIARGKPGSITTLSYHDTMNSTALLDGAISKPRPPEGLLPQIVAISNRGDHQGNARPEERPTMQPEHIQLLAQCLREGFSGKSDDVMMNQPYLGSREVGVSREISDQYRDKAASIVLSLDAVQFEFRREFLLGEKASKHIMKPGDDWPATDEEHLEKMALACKKSWDIYRNRLNSEG